MLSADRALMRVCECQSFFSFIFNAWKIFAPVFMRLCGRQYRLR